MQKKYIGLKKNSENIFRAFEWILDVFQLWNWKAPEYIITPIAELWLTWPSHYGLFYFTFVFFCFVFLIWSWKIEFFESSFCLGVWAKDVEAVGNPKEVAVFPHKSINSPFLSHSLISFTASVSHSDSTKHHLQWFQMIWAVLWFGSPTRSVNLLTYTFTNSVINTNNDLWADVNIPSRLIYRRGLYNVYLNKNK